MQAHQIKTPKSVAIIMDGNGRWANQKNHSRSWGHIQGALNVKKIVKKADELGVKQLVLYAFSTENINRPKSEVNLLFKLLKRFILKEAQEIISENIKFKIIGDYSLLENETKALIDKLKRKTESNTGIELIFAFNYGGRSEIINSINSFIEKNPGQKICQRDLEANLYDSELKEIDLVIRTGGDYRISNFLIWQVAYSELAFTDTQWPEFSKCEFEAIVCNFASRERRFGRLPTTNNLVSSEVKP